MKRKIVWIAVSCLMVLSLVLASCAPAVVEEEEVVSGPREGPIYGGTFNILLDRPPLGFDEGFITAYTAWTMNFTNEELLTGDWTKGIGGTGEHNWRKNTSNFLDLETPCLAESWELTDPETIVFKIRKNVYFHDKPPVNGREMNAHDVVYSLNRLYFEEPGAYLYTTRKADEKPTSITAPDDWTVVVKCPSAFMGPNLRLITDCARIVPREMVEEHGDLRDWENACGTGPFLFTDYVPGSIVKFERNPDYWGTDPYRPQNKLPYLDSVEFVIIEDVSTQLAALRTAQVDFIHELTWESAETLERTTPELEVARYLASCSYATFMRTDRPELPFYDKRVRQALSMAIDRQAMVDDLYDGNALVRGQPVMPYGPFLPAYIPDEELPDNVQELYEYNPDKAKQLLVDAGYPDGFETSIVVHNAASAMNVVTVVKEYWSQIGVDLDIQPKEYGVWFSIVAAREHEAMSYKYCNNDTPFKLLDYRPESMHNQSMVDDPHMNEVNAEMQKNIAVNDERAYQLLKEMTPYVLEQCWFVDLPITYDYTAWWPWVRTIDSDGMFHGEWCVGYLNIWNSAKYIWIDQEFKKEMGY